MKAININVNEFINVLNNLKNNKIELIDLDMIQDEKHPNMNKLIIHPVKNQEDLHMAGEDMDEDEFPDILNRPDILSNNMIEIKNHDFNTNNNDIFEAFEDIL